jgi:hypothetical protein
LPRNLLKHLWAIFCATGLLSLIPATGWGSFMLPPSGYRAKDFAMVRHEGLYHLFYIRRNVSAHPDSTERDFGHAISWDLLNWTQVDPVVPIRPDKWDNRHVWAPSIVESDGIFYMFYTGVTYEPNVTAGYQRIGVATSTDLFTWNRGDEPLLSCEDTPWAFCNEASGSTSFRDAYVMRHPQIPGEWLHYVSTSLAADSSSMVIGSMGAPDPLGPWSDLGPLMVTNVATTSSKTAESMHLFDHDGLWHMIWTSNRPQPLVWATSPDPFAPSPAWTYRGMLGTMLGFDTTPWFASEHLRVGLIDYFAAASLTAIEILRIQWTSPTTYQLLQPTTFHMRRMYWSKPVVADGDTAALTLDATGWFGKSAEIEVLEVDAGGAQTLVPNHHVGLPQQIPMNANPTVYTWTARGIQDGTDGEPGPELVVRLKDQTAIAPEIRVSPVPVSYGGGGELDDDAGDGFIVRFMAFSPVGSAFRVDLGRAADVRLDVFDVGGRRVQRVHAGVLNAGVHVLRFDPKREGLSSGVYFARLSTTGGTHTARFAVAR